MALDRWGRRTIEARSYVSLGRRPHSNCRTSVGAQSSLEHNLPMPLRTYASCICTAATCEVLCGHVRAMPDGTTKRPAGFVITTLPTALDVRVRRISSL